MDRVEKAEEANPPSPPLLATPRMEQTCETVIQATENSLGKGLDVGVFDCCADLHKSVCGRVADGATSERGEKPLRHEATVVLEPL